MASLGGFLSKFGGMQGEEALDAPSVLSASAPNALGAFLETFTTLTESYFFYGNTEELKYDVEKHAYFRVDPDLGNLIELHGVTNVLKVIDKSPALVPWAAKKCAEKILRTVPLSSDSTMLAPISLIDFTKLVMEAKGAHKEILDEAGDVGHAAHKCLEDSIQHVLDHTEDHIVRRLINIPADEKAAACALAEFRWMQRHNVRWNCTEKKVYSRQFGFAGTMDGEALVDSCDDPSCCTEKFKDSLSVIDWKSSNAIHIEYIIQAAGAYRHAVQEETGKVYENCFVLRGGKNEEEAGKFEPLRIPSTMFPAAFRGFILSLDLINQLEEIQEWFSTQKRGVREVKKQMKAEQKEIAKMQAKLKRAEEKAQKKLDRAAERERIKADAKKAREDAKLAKKTEGQLGVSVPVSIAVLSVPSQPIPFTNVPLPTPTLEEAIEIAKTECRLSGLPEPFTEEGPVERKPFVIPEEG